MCGWKLWHTGETYQSMHISKTKIKKRTFLNSNGCLLAFRGISVVQLFNFVDLICEKPVMKFYRGNSVGLILNYISKPFCVNAFYVQFKNIVFRKLARQILSATKNLKVLKYEAPRNCETAMECIAVVQFIGVSYFEMLLWSLPSSLFEIHFIVTDHCRFSGKLSYALYPDQPLAEKL